MVKIEQLVNVLNEIAPESLQTDWDNTGVQIYPEEKGINRILVTLEITETVIKEAIAEEVDFIVSHHPLFFVPLKQIDIRTASGKYAVNLIRHQIGVYASHIPFDIISGGNNDYILEAIGANVIESGDALPFKTAIFPEKYALREVILRLKQALSIEIPISVAGDQNQIIAKVGVCTGAGAEYIRDAKAAGCDLMITGDVKHHEWQMALELGIALVDAGHFDTEKGFVENMGGKLREKLARYDVQILESSADSRPYDMI